MSEAPDRTLPELVQHLLAMPASDRTRVLAKLNSSARVAIEQLLDSPSGARHSPALVHLIEVAAEGRVPDGLTPAVASVLRTVQTGRAVQLASTRAQPREAPRDIGPNLLQQARQILARRFA